MRRCHPHTIGLGAYIERIDCEISDITKKATCIVAERTCTAPEDTCIDAEGT
jgi:hypothetical protein